MSAPLKDEECLIAMYDSFAKTVMRNECRNIVDAQKRQKKREAVASAQYPIDRLFHVDIYPSEHFVVDEADSICVVSNEKLYHALLHLPDNHRTVIIL